MKKIIKKTSRSTALILAEAERLGIKSERLPHTNLYRLKYHESTKYYHDQIPSETTEFAYYCCNNKRISSLVLEEAGVSVSKGYLLQYSDIGAYKPNLFKHLKKPLVVKPVADSKGNNVYLNINSKQECIAAIQKIHRFYGGKKVEVLIEEMFEGDEYRILATQEKIISVIQRIVPNVVGDGISSIEQLVEQKNKDPIRVNVGIYTSLVIDAVALEYLKQQQLKMESILEVNQRVFLRPHSSLDIAMGGDTIDVTEKIHPSVKTIVDTIMKSIPGLSLTGIDFMCKNIFSKQTVDSYRIIEINASPSLDWNESPLEGRRRNIGYEFLKIMFPTLPKTAA